MRDLLVIGINRSREFAIVDELIGYLLFDRFCAQGSRWVSCEFAVRLPGC